MHILQAMATKLPHAKPRLFPNKNLVILESVSQGLYNLLMGNGCVRTCSLHPMMEATTPVGALI